MRVFWLWILGAALLVTPHVRATERWFHADLVRAEADLAKARGPEAYAALRRIWSTWDRADPTHVEEALASAARSSKLEPPLRTYAEMLRAYARLRRGDVRAATDAIEALGFVRSWLLVGPFDNEGKAGLSAVAGPEAELSDTIVFGRAFTGKERPVRWRVLPDAFPFGFVDLGAVLRPESKVCGFLRTTVSSKGATAPRTISLWVGSGGAFRVYFNGQSVLEDTAYRRHDADRFATRVRLEAGTNDLAIKVCGDDQAPAFSLRLADERGAPDPRLTARTDPKALEEAAATVTRLKGKRGNPPGGLEGPVQHFERSTRGPKTLAATDDAYLHYLVETGGDDPTEHRARDLAKRVADKEPTVERLLLAARLAEDRNHAKLWLDRATARAERDGREPAELGYARVAHLLGGPSWRSAVAPLDRLLAEHPDHVEGLRARVQLYNNAGLRRTAAALLGRANERNPSSVSILNMLASQLRAIGRDTDAAELESRYFSLRGDDRTFVHAQIDLFVARRDRASAERWIERLLALDPDSQWAFGVAARSYRALGQSGRAVATYQRALALAPEDVGTLRALADLQGELGKKDEQIALLRQILKIRPQDKEVREYVAHIEPDRPKPDEAYAWNEKRFLRHRNAPAGGQTRRTLRDLTVSTVFENGLSSQFRQVVYQPLTDAAAAMARQHSFQYQADRQVVQLRGARVYRGDGRTDEAIEYGESAANDPSISMYTSARNFTVQLPRLDPGDVVELRYRIDDVTPRNEFADYFGEVTYLQSDEPIKNAEYVLITPKTRRFFVDERLPGLKREVKEKDGLRIHRFFIDDVPPLVAEPAMPPWSEVLGFVHVSTYETWKDLGRWYWGLIRDQFDLDDQTRKLARDVARGKTTDREKVAAVYNWVIENTRYVALEFGIYGYKPRRCVQTVARGWGDCKDKATVIVSLLSELGIDSTIVILRTGMRGDFHSKIPSLAPFDHAIVYVPSLDLYLDGTAEYAGITELPRMDLGALGLLVNKGDSKLTRLPEADPTEHALERTTVAELARDGSAKLELRFVTRGVSAPEWRRRYDAEATRRERVGADVAREFPGFSIVPGAAGLSTNDLRDFAKPVEMTVRGSAPSFARREADRLSMAVTPTTRLTPAYASLSQRKLDVRIAGFSTVDETVVVKLTAGTRVISAPAATRVDTPFGSYSVEVQRSEREVRVRGRLSLKVSRISPKQYAQWKKFCADVDAAFAPRLVVGS